MTRPRSRLEHAEAVTPPGGQPACPVCGRPLVRAHRCSSPPVTGPMPKDFRDQLEEARRLAAEGIDPLADHRAFDPDIVRDRLARPAVPPEVEHPALFTPHPTPEETR